MIAIVAHSLGMDLNFSFPVRVYSTVARGRRSMADG